MNIYDSIRNHSAIKEWSLYGPVGEQHEQPVILIFFNDHAYFSPIFQLADQKDIEIRKALISLNFSFSAFHEQIIFPF